MQCNSYVTVTVQSSKPNEAIFISDLVFYVHHILGVFHLVGGMQVIKAIKLTDV